MAPRQFISKFERGSADPDWPRVEDLDDRNSRVFIDEEQVARVSSLLRQHEVCLLRGAEGRGKTVLARTVSRRFLDQKWDVYILDFARVDDMPLVEENVRTIGSRKSRLIVLENVHRAGPDVLESLLNLKYEMEFRASLLLTQRWIPQSRTADGDDPLDGLAQKGRSVPLHPGLDMVLQIVRKTAPSYSLDEDDERWILKEIGGAPNLRRLRWFLDAWLDGPRDGRLAHVPPEKVYRKVYEAMIGPASNPDPVVQVAAILQFELGFDSVVLGIGTDEIDREGLIFRNDRGFYVIAHSSDSALLIEAVAHRLGQRPGALTSTKVAAYLGHDPPPRNTIAVLRALIRSENQVPCDSLPARDIRALVDVVAHESPGAAALLIQYVIKAHNPQIAGSTWSLYQNKIAETGGSVEDTLRGELAAASIEQIFSLAAIPARVAPDLHRILREPSCLDLLFEKANSTNYQRFATLLRELFLRGDTIPDVLSPERLAARVAALRLNPIQPLLFIHRLNPTIDASYIERFVRWLAHDPGFIERASQISFQSILDARGAVRAVDRTLAGYCDVLVPEEVAVRCLESTSFHDIRRFLVFWSSTGMLSNTVDPKTIEDRLAGVVLRRLSAGSLKEDVEKIANPVAEIIRFFGVMVRVKIDPEVLAALADQTVQVLLPRPLPDPDGIASLLGPLRRMNDSAWRSFAKKVAAEADLGAMARSIHRRGPQILWHVWQADPVRGADFASGYFSFAPFAVLDSWTRLKDKDGSPFHLLLGNLAQIDPTAARTWIHTHPAEAWAVRLAKEAEDRPFSSLLILLHLDREFALSILRMLVAHSCFPGPVLKPDALPFAGLSLHVIGKLPPGRSLPSANRAGSWLADSHTTAAWTFAAYALLRLNPILAHTAFEIARRQMRNRHVDFNLTDRVSAILDPGIREMISSVLSEVNFTRFEV